MVDCKLFWIIAIAFSTRLEPAFPFQVSTTCLPRIAAGKVTLGRLPSLSALHGVPILAHPQGDAKDDIDQDENDTLRAKLREKTGFSLTALRNTLRAATGISLTAIYASAVAISGMWIRKIMAVIMSIFPTQVSNDEMFCRSRLFFLPTLNADIKL